METEGYNNRLTPAPNPSPALPALPPLPLPTCYMQTNVCTRALLQTAGATAAVGSVWQGWSALTKGEAASWIVLIWCHVNISGLNPRCALLSLADQDRQRPKASALMTCETQDGHSDRSANRSGRWFYKFQCTPWAPVACFAHKQQHLHASSHHSRWERQNEQVSSPSLLKYFAVKLREAANMQTNCSFLSNSLKK